ncbi:MAG: hypothetical protein GF401_01550 [Chitinivibrionales bacterium]|nr:hypothetical protein [Chitinivibrionales bacterium]
MNPATKKTHLLSGAILLLSSVMIFLYGRIDPGDSRYSEWDLHYYRQIARNAPDLPSQVPEPFSYRILGPFLVGALPFPTDTAFYGLAIFCALILPVLLFYFLKTHSIRNSVAFPTTLFFLCNTYIYGFNVWDPYQINDTISLILLLVMFWSLSKGNFAAFAIAAAVSAFARELFLLFIPVGLVFFAEKGELKQKTVPFIIATVPALLLFIALRIAISSPADKGLTYYFTAFFEHVPKIYSFNTWFRILINAFAPFSLVPIVFGDQTKAFIRNNKYMIVFALLVFISSLFGGDNERLVAPAFAVFYLLMARIIQNEPFFTPAVRGILLVMAFLNSLHHSIARYPVVPRNGTIALTIGTTLGTAILLLFLKSKGSERSEEMV